MDNLQSDTSSMDDQIISSNMNNANLNDEERALNNEEEIAFPEHASVTNTLTDSYKLLSALRKEHHDLKMEEAQLDDKLKEGLDKLERAKANLSMFAAKCEDRAIHLELLEKLVNDGQEKVNTLRKKEEKIQVQLAKAKELQVMERGMFEDGMKKIIENFTSGPKLHNEGILLDQISEAKATISKSGQMVALYNREKWTTELQFSAAVKGSDELKSGLTCLVNHINGQVSEAKKENNILEDQRKELTNSLDTLTMHVKGLQSQNLRVHPDPHQN